MFDYRRALVKSLGFLSIFIVFRFPQTIPLVGRFDATPTTWPGTATVLMAMEPVECPGRRLASTVTRKIKMVWIGSKPCTLANNKIILQVDVRPKHDMIHLYAFWIPLLRAIQKRNLIHTVKGILQDLEHCTVHGRLSLLEKGMGEQLGADSKAIHGPVLWKALMPASLKNGAGNGVTSQKDRRTCWTNTEHSH